MCLLTFQGISSGAHVIRQSRRTSMHNLSLGLLIQTQNIPGRIGESGGDFRRVCAQRLHDRTAICRYLVNGRGYAINHDVDQQSHVSHRFAIQHPGAADLTDTVIKCQVTVAPRSDIPTENFFVEGSGSIDILRGYFDVANLTLAHSWLFAFAHGVWSPNRVSSPRVSKGCLHK